MRFIKVLLLLALFLFGLLFFVQNSAALDTKLALQFDLYYGFKWEGRAVPFYFVVLAAFGVGMFFATALLFIDRIRLSCSLMSRKRAMRVLEKEIERLRTQVAKETKIIEAKSSEVKNPGQPGAAVANAGEKAA
jgi:cell division protein FtsB